MKNYWSLSKFADAIRKAFGISPMPRYASSEGWDTYNNTAKAQSSFGVKLIDSLDTIQEVVNYIPDKIHGVFYFIKNIKNSSNCLRTNIKIGQWSDLCNRIPEALLISVIDFVEKECFWMNIVWASDKDEQSTWSSEVIKYKHMSYFSRIFFGKVSTEDRAKHGLEYLKFQLDNSTDKEPVASIIAAYKFAKVYFTEYEKTIAALYDEVKEPFLCNNNKDVYCTISAYEKATSDLITLHCTNIVKYREYLWT